LRQGAREMMTGVLKIYFPALLPRHVRCNDFNLVHNPALEGG